MKTTWISFLLITAFSIGLQAQGTLKEALNQVKAQGDYSTLVYYGADFSHVLINDAPKIPKSLEYSKVYPAAWIAFVANELPPEGYVQRVLKFPAFQYQQKEIYDNSIAVDRYFITDHDNNILPDTLQAMVLDYTLQETSGLGLVLIPETFSKAREVATTWIVFFDVGSRQIIYKTRAYGKCSHMGYTAHWGSGVAEGFKNFARP